MSKSQFTIEPGKQELTIVRVLNAPVEAVFKAHLDPAAIPQWWGPGGLETTVELLEARTGGRWRFSQRDPQGNAFAFYGVYHEVTAPHRIVQTFEFSGYPGQVQLETLTLEDLAGKTRLTAHSVFGSVEARDGMVASGMEGGFEEGMMRLEKLLSKEVA